MTSPQGADSPMISDVFMALRLLADVLKDIPLTIDPGTSRVRTKIEDSITINANVPIVTTVTTVSSVTNIDRLGGRDALIFQNDIMDKVFLEAVRLQII
jgi:hypothetical protein